MVVDEEKLFRKLEENGEETVEGKLLKGDYKPEKRPLVKLWLRNRKDRREDKKSKEKDKKYFDQIKVKQKRYGLV